MKKIVMTGVTSGLGVEWLYELDRLSEAEFFIIARNKSKFENIVNNRPLKNEFRFIECDFNSIKSIKMAADLISTYTDVVDLLINNAGVWSSEEIEYSNDNIEVTFAVNQVAPYILTGKLLNALSKSEHSLIINTASFRHSDANIDINDAQMASSFNAEQAYCNSKLYAILFTKHLARILNGTPISAVCFDPGIVDTPMLKVGFPRKLAWLYPVARRLIARSPLKGAETGVFLATERITKDLSGNYFKDMKVKKPSKMANDQSLASWLWCETEKISGYKYPELGKNIA